VAPIQAFLMVLHFVADILQLAPRQMKRGMIVCYGPPFLPEKAPLRRHFLLPVRKVTIN
jgi:hypothetical protein